MKILLFLLLLTISVFAQVYDEPIDSTNHYNLRLYEQGARVPAAILNEDKMIIDSVLYSLIVYTDTLHFVMVLDTNISNSLLTFKISNYSNGISSFSGTNTTDTFTVSGSATDTLKIERDLFWLQPIGSSITSNDVLSYSILAPRSIIVTRPAAGTSNLQYSWRWIRRY